MILVRIKIPETGKHVHDGIEVVDPERQPHVMLVKRQMLVFEMAGKRNAGRGNIKTGDIESFFRQIPGVPAFATGKVEYVRIGGELKRLEQVVNKMPGLPVVVTLVQDVVIWRVKPGGEPIAGHKTMFFLVGKVARFCAFVRRNPVLSPEKNAWIFCSSPLRRLKLPQP